MTFVPKHPQVDLPELGFSVDEGLEELIRACWHRGIATDFCCIGGDGDKDWHDGQGHVGFFYPEHAKRWEAVTGHECEWNDIAEVVSVAEAYFDPSEIPSLVERLRDV